VSVAWAGQSYQERLSSGQAPILYGVALIVVFLCLAALYESWTIPLAVILVVPLGIVGALLGAKLTGLDNNIYLQVGLITTMGLASKNAILIIEFAEFQLKEGANCVEAAVAAAKLRLRPILMTSFAFVFGVLPLAIATGPGAGAQTAIGRAVVGDVSVCLCGVIADRRLGAEQIIIMGRERLRTALAQEFGATDVVSERGEEGIARVRELTQGLGAQSVLECVGTELAMDTAMGIVRAGGAVGRVGVPHYEVISGARQMFYGNVIVGGGPAPTRAYIEELLPDVLDGRIDPGRVFDRTVDLDGVPEGYRAMNEREALKVLIRP
jgi:Zn-dependent alcohol dehydrogenase